MPTLANAAIVRDAHTPGVVLRPILAVEVQDENQGDPGCAAVVVVPFPCRKVREPVGPDHCSADHQSLRENDLSNYDDN